MTRRIPRDRGVTLNQRRLFIFPSRHGLSFIALLLVLLVIAINYQNNLIYGMVFLLGTVLVVAIHLTFANLHSLTLRGVKNDPVFLGETAAIGIELEVTSRKRTSLTLALAGDVSTVNVVEPATTTKATLCATPEHRGCFQPGRILLDTRFPLGLVRCWSWLDLAEPVWVYPKPLKPQVPPRKIAENGTQTAEKSASRIDPAGDDIHSFRGYQQSDSLKQIHWPSLARGDDVLVKLIGESVVESSTTIDFEDYPSTDTETRLSWMCYRVVAACNTNQPFVLRLPGVEMLAKAPRAQREEALMALAKFVDESQTVDAL